MAIERNHFGGSTQSSDLDNSNRLKQLLDTLNDLEQELCFDDKRIQDECNRVVRELVTISIPTTANKIKEFQNYLTSVGQSLERIIRKSPHSEHIFISCLQTLYCSLVSNGKWCKWYTFLCLFYYYRIAVNVDFVVVCCVFSDSPSAGSGIIFDIYDQDSIPKAIKLLIKNTENMGVDNDNEFKKVTQTLCTWLRTFSGLKNLSHCIIYFLDGLRVSNSIHFNVPLSSG